MNLAKPWWFTLLLIGVLFLIFGVIAATRVLSSCGDSSGCSYYWFPGVDAWAVILGFTDLGVVLVYSSLNRLGKLAPRSIAS
jgi:hypothetical protein